MATDQTINILQRATRASPIAMAIALSIMLGIVAYPPFLINIVTDKPDHMAAMFMYWSMSAGFIRGIGFIPKNKTLSWLFGHTACFVCLLLAISHVRGWW